MVQTNEHAFTLGYLNSRQQIAITRQQRGMGDLVLRSERNKIDAELNIDSLLNEDRLATNPRSPIICRFRTSSSVASKQFFWRTAGSPVACLVPVPAPIVRAGRARARSRRGRLCA